MNIPSAAPFLAKLDDWVGNGERNLTKSGGGIGNPS